MERKFQVLEVSEAAHSCGAYSGDCSCPEIGHASAIDCSTMNIYVSAFYAGTEDELTRQDKGRVIDVYLSEESMWTLC